MKIHPFIFNWKGQYEKTCQTEKQLLEIFDKVTVINSDEENKKDHWVNLDDDAFFTTQFCNAVNLFDGDLMFHIQGDVTYYNWKGIVDSAIKYYDKYKYGIYAPNVDYTMHYAGFVNINTTVFYNDTNLRMVTMTDCSCWFLDKEIIKKFKEKYILNYAETKYGWGITACMSALSYISKKYVIRDYDYTVNHPKNTGYKQEDAYRESVNFHNSLDKEMLDATIYVRKRNEHKIFDELLQIKRK
jgi:hypothetical protein